MSIEREEEKKIIATTTIVNNEENVKKNTQWYVIRCYSAQEKKAKKSIESQLKINNFEDKIENLVLPTRKENYIRNGKKATREVNFFPGYLLIQFKLDPEILHIIDNTEGVMNILGRWEEIKDEKTGKKVKKYFYIPMRESEINSILGKVDASKEKIENSIDFILGETVIITDGPFANFNGTIEEINEDKKRMKISVKIFGRKTPIDVEFSQVIKQP